MGRVWDWLFPTATGKSGLPESRKANQKPQTRRGSAVKSLSNLLLSLLIWKNFYLVLIASYLERGFLDENDHPSLRGSVGVY